MQILRIAKILVPVALAALILFLVFRNVDFEAFISHLSQVNHWWVVLSIALSVVAYMARAYRWNILLNPVGYKAPLYSATLIILVGYLANLALPRLGEFVRCGLLKRYGEVPINVSLGTVISERVIDVLGLLVLLITALLLEFDVLANFFSETLRVDYHVILKLGLVLLLLGLIGLGLGFMILRGGRFPKVNEFLQGLKNGLISVASIRNVTGFVISTVVLWAVYYLMSYTIVFSLPSTSHLDITAGLMLLVVGGIAIAIPVQSGFGTYHAMVAGLLLIYNIEETTGLFLATLLHTSQIVAMVIFGVLALVLLPLTLRRNNEKIIQE